MESVKCGVFYVVNINLVSLKHEINVKTVFKKPLPAPHKTKYAPVTKTKYAPVTKTNQLRLCCGNNHGCL